MDKKAEAKAKAKAERLQKQKDDARLKELEAGLASLLSRYAEAYRIPRTAEIARLATLLAQREHPEKDEVAALLRNDTHLLRKLAEPHVRKAYSLWEASQQLVGKQLEEEIQSARTAIELHPEEDLHAQWQRDNQDGDMPRLRSAPPKKFEDVLRRVIGKTVRQPDRHQRFREWLRMVHTRRIRSENKNGELTAEALGLAVEKEMALSMEALKADNFSKEQWLYFRENYHKWWAPHLANKRQNRAKKAAAKRWGKGTT